MNVIEKIDEIIAMKHRQLKLLQELRAVHVLAERAGVPADRIARSGYDPKLDGRFKWTVWDRSAFYSEFDAANYVILDDGTRIDCPPDYAAVRDAEWKAWRSARLKEYDQGKHLSRPDVSPAAWKRWLKSAENPANRPAEPPTTG